MVLQILHLFSVYDLLLKQQNEIFCLIKYIQSNFLGWKRKL